MAYEPKSFISSVICLECDQPVEYFPTVERCPVCGGMWLDARYDYDAVASIWRQGIVGRSNSLWRYLELLPVLDPDGIISMGEGNTPLVRAIALQRQLEHPAIYIKDERQSPTSSFKDRQASVVVTNLMQAGIKEYALASTGNAAAAYSAYTARAGIKLWIFLTSLVPPEKMREAALYGAEVIKVTGTYDQAKAVAVDFVARRGIHLDTGPRMIPGKESMKTLAFEIAEELARLNCDPSQTLKWQAPDWYIQAVSGGIGPLGVNKGFEELYRMGLIDRVPKLGIVQVDGCSPMVRAFTANQPAAEAVVPETRITVLSTGIPGFSYELLYRASQRYGGHMTGVSDAEAFKAMRNLARTEGFSVEPAAAVAFAGLEKMIKMGVIKPEETVVVNCSGHTFPVEKHIMNEDVVLDVNLPQKTTVSPRVPVEGLGGALNQLDEQITTIVVIDDNPMDTRLIKRLLQSRKPYRIFEAASALEGLEIISQRLPDLIITDLGMPGMDGFTLVERLKQEPETANIPVIVVTAKDLTTEDEFRLASQTSSIWLKGAFSTHDLVEHVVDTLSVDDNRIYKEAAVPANVPVSGVEKTVVLVEDNPIDARLISRILQVELPLKIRQVQSGTAALDVIRAERPHLIILDLVIPGKNGFQILFELKQDKTLDTIPVIVITSKELADFEKEMLIANGVSSLWQKGQIDRNKLVAQVEAQLE